MNNSGALGTFTTFYNHLLYLIPKYFIIPKESPLNSHSPLPPSLSPLATTHLLCLCRFPFSRYFMIFLRFIIIIRISTSLLFRAEWYSVAWMGHSLFICPLVDIWVVPTFGCSDERSYGHSCTSIYWRGCSNSFGCTPGNGIPGPYANFKFLRKWKLLPTEVISFSIPTAVYESSDSSTAPPTLVFCHHHHHHYYSNPS